MLQTLERTYLPFPLISRSQLEVFFFFFLIHRLYSTVANHMVECKLYKEGYYLYDYCEVDAATTTT